MKSAKLLTLGAAGAAACVGACALVGLAPALLAGGGVALFAEQIGGWQTAAAVALAAAGAIWWLTSRRRKQPACGCASDEAGAGS